MTDLAALASAIAALGTTPITGAAPAGDSARYHEAYAAMESETAKLDNPAGGDVDWAAVLGHGRSLLAETSKDLLIAAWTAAALLHRHRLPGLCLGVQLLRDLIATFPDAIHPQRPKARRAALAWLADRAAGWLNADDVASPDGRDALDACRTALAAIETAVAGRFDPEDSGLSNLRRRLGELASPGNGDSAAASGADATAESASSTASISAPTGSPAPAGGAARRGPPTTRAEAIARLQEAADFFARTEPHSPIGFLVARAITWNGKSFQDIFSELLRNRSDAQEQLWHALGLKPPGE